MLAQTTLLVTGFGPFPGVPYNPSGAAATAIDGARVGEVAIVGRVVPCSWARAWPAIVAAVAAVRPQALVMLGVAAQRTQLEIELVARNVAGARVDCDGGLPGACAPGPATLATTLPWAALPDVARSEDAGDYLCNHVFYRAMAELDVPLRGFVHIPPGPIEPALVLLRRLASVAEGHLRERPDVG